ncbi:MAG TPA: EamA family transporter [Anaerolineales bacterium]|nr:EamA family transporter [Anaerolineales bacterium]
MTETTLAPKARGRSRVEGVTLVFFTLAVIIGGSNAVAVRFSNVELPPFWGAAMRFATAAVLFWIILVGRGISVPKGRALAGHILYGSLAVGGSYAFLYWALLHVHAGLAMIVLALGPLLTMFLALAHGLERFQPRALAGALISLAGIVIAAGLDPVNAVPLPALLALVAGAVCIAEGSVLFKIFPKSDPVATNAVAFTTGAALLTVVSLLAGERWGLPSKAATWAAFVYLATVGSVVLFYLYLFILARWTASATSYSFLLFPVATTIIAAWLAKEMVTPHFLVGGAVVLAGVWLGALSQTPRS